ncbi:uncharacterized protein LOC142328273 isoform X3 [Lycorma delicatula]|uniref:uncharacterized protein LOC142328273 isoform X3 n=1 Tax=Lycorma delicatula TaxID=130591 RepID=UPI003F50D810
MESSEITQCFDSDVATFLFGMNLNKYIEHFSKEAIDLKTFLTLTDEDLCFIGVTDLEDRRTLLKGIINLKSHKNSNTVITDDIALSDKDVLVIASNALKQLSILHAAVAHTRLRLKATPVRNTIIDQHSVASLLTTLSLEGMLQNQILQTRLNGFENLVMNLKENKRFVWIQIDSSKEALYLCGGLYCVVKSTASKYDQMTDIF